MAVTPFSRSDATASDSATLEWPTWLLWGGILTLWLGILYGYAYIPLWVSTPFLIVLLAWYSSFQHELVHGHPTRNASINRLLGLPPLGVWYPFDTYKTDHLKHHDDAYLTIPGIDTESNYITPAQAAMASTVSLWLWQSQRTVLGRFCLGPALVIVGLAKRVVRAFGNPSHEALGSWVLHFALLALLLVGLKMLTPISLWLYCFGIAYPALGLAMLRSLLEHRPGELPTQRTVINEAAWPWRLLYLNNNYHSVHHAYPQLPWYRIPAQYWADRDGYVARNGGFLLHGYWPLIRDHAWKPVDQVVQELPAPKEAR